MAMPNDNDVGWSTWGRASASWFWYARICLESMGALVHTYPHFLFIDRSILPLTHHNVHICVNACTKRWIYGPQGQHISIARKSQYKIQCVLFAGIWLVTVSILRGSWGCHYVADLPHFTTSDPFISYIAKSVPFEHCCQDWVRQDPARIPLLAIENSIKSSC